MSISYPRPYSKCSASLPSDGAQRAADSRNALSVGDRIRLKINETLVHSLNRRPMRSDPSRGLVSFTFDDFPTSAYRTGGAILERYGVRGTYYAALSLLGAECEGHRMMSSDDIADLISHGHELGCHSYSHISCPGLDRRQLEIELRRNSRELEKIAKDTKLANFSYPFGDISLPAKRTVSSHFETCRGRRSGLNVGTMDLAALNSESLYTRCDPIERALSAISRTAEQRGWLIFCAHDVTDDPSPYGCTPGHLETAVKAAVDSGSEVVTIADAYSRLTHAIY